MTNPWGPNQLYIRELGPQGCVKSIKKNVDLDIMFLGVKVRELTIYVNMVGRFLNLTF